MRKRLKIWELTPNHRNELLLAGRRAGGKWRPSVKDWTKVMKTRVLQEEEIELVLGFLQLSTCREEGPEGHPGLGLTHPDSLKCECLSLCFSSAFTEAFLVLEMSPPLLVTVGILVTWRVYSCAVSRDTKTSSWNQGFSQASLNESKRPLLSLSLSLAESSVWTWTNCEPQTPRTRSGEVVICGWWQPS